MTTRLGEALLGALPEVRRISTASSAVTGLQIVDGAERLAAWLRSVPIRAPLVTRFADVIGPLVTTLAGDLAGVPVIHVDPANPVDPAGIRAAGEDLPARAAYADESLQVYAALPQFEVDSGGLPDHSYTFLTTGSTGQPTAVVRSADAVKADAERVGQRLGYHSGAPVILGVPACHVYGFNYGVVAALMAGASVHYCGPRVIPSQVARAVEEHSAETLIGHPAFFRLVAQEALRREAAALPGLTRAVSAGAPLPPGTAEAIARYEDFTLFSCYGSSEAGAVTLSPVDGTEPPGTVGVPLPGVEARIEDEVLYVRTSSLADGYRTDTGIRPLAEADGWYRTGDLASVVDGVVSVRGRVASVINVAGRKVSPEEIEEILTAHPGIVDAAVHGLADEVRGEMPVARVVLRDGTVIGDVLEWCRTRLAPHMVPRRFDQCDELPRSATGKRLRATGTEQAR